MAGAPWATSSSATPTSKLVDTRQRPPTGFQPAAAAASATSTAPAFHPMSPPQQQQRQQPQHAHTMKALAQQLLQGQRQQQQLSDQGASSASFVVRNVIWLIIVLDTLHKGQSGPCKMHLLCIPAIPCVVLLMLGCG